MSNTFQAATRQELLKLKEKQKSAKRGHKLLKDKRDSLIQIFMAEYRETSKLRKEFDLTYIAIRERYKLATTDISSEYIEAISQTSEMNIAIDSKLKNIMGVKVQEIESKTSGSVMNYSRLETNHHLDSALFKLQNLLPKAIMLIEKEYKVRKLAEEIEKTRKRVNALEYVILPELAEQIKYIGAKLAELALQNTVRLMKIKQTITAPSA